VQKLLSDLPKEQHKLVEDIVPSQINVSGIQRVLQTLLNERISIRDLSGILEGIAEAVGFTRSVNGIAEHVRTRLARQICAQNLSHAGYLPLISLSPAWELAFAEALQGDADDKHLAMAPSKLGQFVNAVRDAFEDAARIGEIPVLLTSPQIRPHVRSIVERFRAHTVVMSQAEVHPRVRLKTVGTV
jgi:flagellar biosynthesis protein FlhA